MGKNKTPKFAFQPNPQMSPKIAAQSTSGESVIWCFASFDNYAWGDEKEHQEDPFTEVAKSLRDFGRRTRAEIEKNRKHDHAISVPRLVPEAQKRLKDIKQDDTEALWRFRFSGERRIWGIRSGRLFKVIWWDPKHSVCPSELKHT